MSLAVLATVAVALAVRLQNLLLGLPKGSPRLKMLFGIFFCLQSQIAVWALKRLRAFLLSLRMRMIREHAQTIVSRGGMVRKARQTSKGRAIVFPSTNFAQTHTVKKLVDLYQASSLNEARILLFLLRLSYIQMHTPFAVHPH